MEQSCVLERTKLKCFRPNREVTVAHTPCGKKNTIRIRLRGHISSPNLAGSIQLLVRSAKRCTISAERSMTNIKGLRLVACELVSWLFFDSSFLNLWENHDWRSSKRLPRFERSSLQPSDGSDCILLIEMGESHKMTIHDDKKRLT